MKPSSGSSSSEKRPSTTASSSTSRSRAMAQTPASGFGSFSGGCGGGKRCVASQAA